MVSTVQIWRNDSCVPAKALTLNLCNWIAIVNGKRWAYFGTRKDAETACIEAGF